MLSDWALRLRSIFKRAAVEKELDDELRFHLEQQAAAYVRQGLTHHDAIRRAQLEFGGLDQIREEHRDARGVRFVDDLGRDLRHAARQIRRSPGFAQLAVLCLGLGIGVNTAIFGVIDSVLLRPMAVTDPDRLVMLTRGERTGFSLAVYRDLRDRTRVLSGLAATLPMESDMDVDGDSDFVAAEVVSAHYADVLGVRPSIGRWFADDREPAAVISHAVWERRFNSSPQAVGRVIRSESQTYTIVGIAPREFTGVFAPWRTDLWVPVRTRPALATRLEQGSLTMMLFGRLQRGATTAQTSAELNTIGARLAAEQGATPEDAAPILADTVQGIPNPRIRRSVQLLTSFMAAVVGLVLLIACVNVGNLLLVRGALRHREFAVRRALGASRSRLVRQLLTESLLLALGGGACGVVLAVWTNKLLVMSVPAVVAAMALHLDLSVDWRALVFATAISLVATVLCGLLPAWRTSQVRGTVAFKGEIGGRTTRRHPLGLVAQVVMSLVLLFLAGSFVQALLRLQGTDPGFEVVRRLYAFVFVPAPSGSDERHELYSRIVDRLQATPGVRRASLASSLPLMPAPPRADCASGPARQQIPTTTSAVSEGFFDTFGIGLVAGRGFVAGDVATAPAPVIVNETLARRIWSRSEVVGERVDLGCRSARPAVVIGVVRDSAIRDVGEAAQPHLYSPFAPEHAGGLTAVVVETDADVAAMAEPVRRALLASGNGIRVYAVHPLSTHVEQSYAQVRWMAAALTTFGSLALVLAAIGLYGVIAYRVTLRTQEIGVRMALGATPRDIFREVVSHGLAVVLVGVAIGEILTAGVTGVVGSMQEGVRPSTVSAHVGVALIWVAVACMACYVPAARAARVDPLVALRHE